MLLVPPRRAPTDRPRPQDAISPIRSRIVEAGTRVLIRFQGERLNLYGFGVWYPRIGFEFLSWALRNRRAAVAVAPLADGPVRGE
jgi:hypothetical protein